MSHTPYIVASYTIGFILTVGFATYLIWSRRRLRQFQRALAGDEKSTTPP